MKNLKVYDPAMCCSTGVCGPNVDPKLVRLAADLEFLKSQGIKVERFNLAHQPGAFVASPQVISEMGPGAEHLPLFLLDGEVMAKGVYPTRQELCGWCGIEAAASSRKPLTGLRMAGVSEGGCCSGDEGCC